MSKDFYRRNLPHYQPEAATFFVTIRLDGSLPQEAVERLQLEQRELEDFYSGIAQNTARKEKAHQLRDVYFAKFEDLLDGAATGPHWLREPHIASIVSEALHYRDGREYELICFSIMPNHVHVVFTPKPVERLGESLYTGGATTGFIVTDILGSLKKYTGREANKVLGRAGAFWQHESYDHVIRNSEELSVASQKCLE